MESENDNCWIQNLTLLQFSLIRILHPETDL